ncbi:MAG: hypothetical protein CSA33_00780 [Desulfobulbus propionicus]|nr:MAG: hypothetical protein CSA33_00780 [Desulfobulbus propionicus]
MLLPSFVKTLRDTFWQAISHRIDAAAYMVDQAGSILHQDVSGLQYFHIQLGRFPWMLSRESRSVAKQMIF